MTFFQALTLSIVQGLTEFLPVSSSGHLIVFPHLFGWQDQGLAFDAIVHVGTAAAVIVYYRAMILDFFRKLARPEGQKLLLVFFVSMVPAVIAGMLLKDVLSDSARSVRLVAFSLLAWGLILMLAEYYAQIRKRERGLDEMNVKDGILIGLAQALALIPGTSRSGITMSAAFFRDISRQDAVAFSFLMGVPVILGAGGLSFIDYLGSDQQTGMMPILVGLSGAFLSGMAGIHVVKKVVKKHGFYWFGAYRILLGLALLTFLS